MKVKSESKVVQSCPTLRDPMDCSLPGSSIHGIFQARILEWGAIAFSVLRRYWVAKWKQWYMVQVRHIKKPPAAEENASLPISLCSFLCLDVTFGPFIGTTVSMFLSDFLISYQSVPTGSQLPHHPLLQRLFGGSRVPGGFTGGVEFCQPIIRVSPLDWLSHLFLWIFSEPSAHQPKNNTPLKNLGCLLRFRAQMFYLISTFLDLYIVPISVMRIVHCTSLCASLYLLDDWCCFFLPSVCS